MVFKMQFYGLIFVWIPKQDPVVNTAFSCKLAENRTVKIRLGQNPTQASKLWKNG